MFYYVTRKFTKLSFSEIGSYFDQNHSTVIHAVNTMDNLIETDAKIASDYTNIIALLTGYQQSELCKRVGSVVEFKVCQN